MAESSGESTFTSSRSPTPSTSESGVGRPKRSPVWQHFVFDNVTGKSVCQIVTDGNELESGEKSVCGHEVAGKFPTNLKQHLKSSIPSIIKLF